MMRLASMAADVEVEIWRAGLARVAIYSHSGTIVEKVQ
jgi:hypothetical protein